MGLTMSEKVQAARDRALLISQQDADAPRLTDRLDAQSLAVLVEAFDATRAKLAEAERERDRATIRAHQVDMAMEHMEPDHHRALASWQAEVARMRGAMLTGDELRRSAEAFDAWGHKSTAAALREMATMADAALASAPGSMDALRDVALQVAGAVWAAAAPSREMDADQCAAIVARILGERSDDAPQGRGERAKEGGDE